MILLIRGTRQAVTLNMFKTLTFCYNLFGSKDVNFHIENGFMAKLSSNLEKRARLISRVCFGFCKQSITLSGESTLQIGLQS
jgi:hypothetical protein